MAGTEDEGDAPLRFLIASWPLQEARGDIYSENVPERWKGKGRPTHQFFNDLYDFVSLNSSSSFPSLPFSSCARWRLQ